MRKKIGVGMLAVSFVFMMTGCCMFHDWQEATCTEPKICNKCGETEGEALGHTWEEATCTEAKTCSVCGETEGEALGHNWQEATCYSLQTCRTCGETTGSYATHQWSEATCQEISTCSLCGETRGGYGDHQWEEATCQTLATCMVCGETTGSYAEHRMGDDAFCTVCGEQMGVLLTESNVLTYLTYRESENTIEIFPVSDYKNCKFINVSLVIDYSATIGNHHGTTSAIVELSSNGQGSAGASLAQNIHLEAMRGPSGYVIFD